MKNAVHSVLLWLTILCASSKVRNSYDNYLL